MDQSVDHSIKRRTYVRCTVLRPGGTSSVLSIKASSRDPAAVVLPEETESFSYFERVEGFAVIDGTARHIQSDEDFNFSQGLFYPDATRHTSKEFAEANPDWGDCLRDPPERPMVRTCKGNWYALGPYDAIVTRSR